MCSCNHVLCRNQGSSAVLLLACLTHNCNLPGPCSRGGNLSPYNLSKKATPSTGWVFNFFYPTGESGRGRWRARGNVLLRSCVVRSLDISIKDFIRVFSDMCGKSFAYKSIFTCQKDDYLNVNTKDIYYI